MALGPFLIVLWHRYKIEVKGNQITACSYFGKEKTFTFDYVTKVNYGANLTKMGRIEYIIAYHEKEKLFSVSAICPGYQVLVSRLNNRNESVN
jgi:iron only hydrogenase large subunit-like protein